MTTLGIIAGGGAFPITVARNARAQGLRIVGVGFATDTDPAFAKHCDHFLWLGLGQLGKLIRFFSQHQVTQVTMAGPINKPKALDLRPDWRAARLLLTTKTRGDDNLLRAVSAELEREGMHVVAPQHYLPDILTPEGILTRRAPTSAQQADIAFGWVLAHQLGPLDIGQCVVVRERIVLAVEAIEGTDAAIRRGGKLGGPGAVVIKRPKTTQDKRLDLPAIGLGTLRVMAEVGATCLAVETGKCLFFEQEEAVSFANQQGISIVGVLE